MMENHDKSHRSATNGDVELGTTPKNGDDTVDSINDSIQLGK